MADIAALGLAVDSDGLVRAIDQLDKFSASAAKAGTASDKTTTSTGRMDRGMSKAATDAARAAGSVDRYAGSSARAAAEGRRAAAGIGSANVQWERASIALRNVEPAAQQAANSINRVTRAANDNVGAMRANTGNIAAQFQDIGVTAAMGMSPMMIALQQGTQLAGVFQQAGTSAFAALGGAIRSVLSPTSLLTIGFVAAAAALIQIVDWTAATQAALNGLADVLVDLAPYAVAFAAAMALIYAPAVITGIKNLIVQMWALRASILAVATTPAVVVAGLLAIVAAAIHFRDDLTRYFGFDIVQAAQDGVNAILNAFIGTYNGIKAVWRQLPAAIGDVVIQAANATIRGLTQMVIEAADLLNPLLGLAGRTLIGAVGGVPQIANPWAGVAKNVEDAANAAYRASQGVDRVTQGAKLARDIFGQAASKLREWSSALNGGTEADAGAGAASDASDASSRGARARRETSWAFDVQKRLADVKAIEPDLRAAWKNIEGYSKSISRDIDETIASRIKAAREVVGGFFASWYDGIRRGQNVFKSFADSVVGGLNRIIDRLMNRAIEGFLGNLIGNAGGLIGGLLGGSSGGGFLNSSASIVGALPNRLGGVYGDPQRFAKGGAFTNSVVTTPTLFRFANGAALGEMGEAGPEAVMPLKRGSDGSLGVQSHGGGRGSVKIENHNNFSFAGAVGLDAIIGMIRQGSEATQAQTKKQLASWLQEYETNGAVA